MATDTQRSRYKVKVPGEISPTLKLNERIRGERAAGSFLHLGFGESNLPVLPVLRQALVAGSRINTYGPVVGDLSLRSCVVSYLRRRAISAEPDLIVVGPGSKSLLFALLAVLPGDLILPKPAWVSYPAQANLVGKRIRAIPVPRESGGVPDPALLTRYLARHRRSGEAPPIVLITQPDNPTGTVAQPKLIHEIVNVARRFDAVLLADHIYSDLTYENVEFLSPAEIASDITFVTTGPSKSLSLGGWRIGVARFPDTPFGHQVARGVGALASEVWSCLPPPMTKVAEIAFSEPPEVVERMRQARELYRKASLRIFELLTNFGGVRCREPQAAFYLYPSLKPVRARLVQRGIRSSRHLADVLLRQFRIAVLEGEAFGDTPSNLAFRISTSYLVGRTRDEHLRALRSTSADGMLELPGVEVAERRMLQALRGLTVDA